MLRSVSLEGRMCLLGVLFGLASYVYTQKWLVLVMVTTPKMQLFLPVYSPCFEQPGSRKGQSSWGGQRGHRCKRENT